MTFKVDVERLDEVRRCLAVEVPADQVSAEIEKAYAELARAAKVRGFRPGRVPRSVLERLFGDRVQAEVFERLIQESYTEAVADCGIPVIGRPEIVTEQASPGVALRYRATVEVKPEVTADYYVGLEVERPWIAVTDADVDAFLDQLRHSLAQLQPITDRSDVRSGDVVTIAYEARIGGRVVGRADGREIEVGANAFPPEFDQHLTGATPGARLRFTVEYPRAYATQELAGKLVEFTVRVQSLARKDLPALDDEFAKDHGECSTLRELRQKVRGRLEAEAAQRADGLARQSLLKALSSAHDLSVPQALVDRRVEALVRDAWRDWQQHRIVPKNEAEARRRLREELEPQAREQVKIALLLEAIARQEGITVDDEEVERQIETLAAEAGSAAGRVRAQYQDPVARQDLRSRVAQSRTIDAVLRRARVTTVKQPASVAAADQNG